MIVWNYVWDVFIKDKYEVFECSSFGKAVVYVVHSVRLLIHFVHGLCSYHIISMLFSSPARIIPCFSSVLSNLLQNGRKFIYK